MTAAFLRAAWVALPDDDSAPVHRYSTDLQTRGGGAGAVFALQPKSAVMRDITSRLDHMDEHRYRTLPTHLVLTEVATLDDGLQLEAALEGPADLTVIVSGLYREVTTVEGVLGPPEGGFGAAVQLGTFSMRSAADEWAVSEWYRTRRLPSFSRIDGGHRARRFVSVCGGPAKLAVLYEFRSLDDRRDHFEPLETVDHDEGRPTAATRTVHPPMSPSVGALLPRP